MIWVLKAPSSRGSPYRISLIVRMALCDFQYLKSKFAIYTILPCADAHSTPVRAGGNLYAC